MHHTNAILGRRATIKWGPPSLGAGDMMGNVANVFVANISHMHADRVCP